MVGTDTRGWQLATSFNTPARWGINALRAGTDVDHNGYPDLALVIDESPNWWSSRNRARAYVETSVPTVPFQPVERIQQQVEVHARGAGVARRIE